METNEMTVNEAVVEEAVADVVTKKTGRKVAIAAGVGMGILIGGLGLAIKYVILPTVAKKKKQDSDVIDGDYEEVDDEEKTDTDVSEEETE